VKQEDDSLGCGFLFESLLERMSKKGNPLSEEERSCSGNGCRDRKHRGSSRLKPRLKGMTEKETNISFSAATDLPSSSSLEPINHLTVLASRFELY
jgi:hypothetical protein